MSQAPKDTRTPAEKARDTAGIIGSFMHEDTIFRILRMKPFTKGPSGAKSRLMRPSRFLANAPLSESDRHWRASVRNPAESPRDAGDFSALAFAV
jgi:hypothetical protein